MQFAIDIALSLIYFAAFLLILAWSWRFWIMYKQLAHWNKIKWIMLEIKLPREIDKSPLAAEVALSSLLQTGSMGNRFNRLFQGNLPQFASIEIASIEGIIHFYVRVQEKYRALVEANFYSQYPGIEIIEAKDYTSMIRYHHLSGDTNMYGASFKLSEKWAPYNLEEGKDYELEMPGDMWPIRTYVDYGMDKNPKPEQTVDPMAPMLEFMGGIGKGQHFWFQMILTDEKNFNGKKWPALYVDPNSHEHLTIKKLIEKAKDKIRIAGVIKKGTKVTDTAGYVEMRTEGEDANGKPVKVEKEYQKDVVTYKKEMELTPDEKGMIDMLNKKLSKPAAHVVIRLIYIAKKENYNFQNVFNILGWGKPFAGMNSFSPSTTDPYEYPWQDPKDERKAWRKEEMFEAYVEREGLFPHIGPRPWLDKWEDSIFWSSSMAARRTVRMFIESFLYPFEHPHPNEVSTLNLEEIATIWHLPSSAVTTPTLPRIESNRGVAPVNLPQ